MCLDSFGNRITTGVCDIVLEPGCYVFRVDGAFNPDIDEITWEFCGAQGGSKTQLNFCVDSNMQCRAKSIKTAEEICATVGSDLSSTTVTLAGTFHLGGLNVADISETESKAIHNALIQEFNDASDSPNGKGAVEIQKLSWIAAAADSKAFGITSNDLYAYQRRLDDNNNHITTVSFEVKLLAERFGVKNIDESGLNHLHTHMNNYLSRSMSVGVFGTKLAHAARSVYSKNLESVDFIRLGTLKVANKDIIKNEISILSTMLILWSVVIAVAFSYMTYKSMRKESVSDIDYSYDTLIEES
jgi:hypothetical protein